MLKPLSVNQADVSSNPTLVATTREYSVNGNMTVSKTAVVGSNPTTHANLLYGATCSKAGDEHLQCTCGGFDSH